MSLPQRRSTTVGKSAVKSRGSLVTDFLQGSASPIEYLQSLDCAAYDGFNLVVGSLNGADGLAYINNRDCLLHTLGVGVHGISNGPIDSHRWPKVDAGKEALQAYLSSVLSDSNELDLEEAVDQILNSKQKCTDAEQLPETPYGHTTESSLSSIFIEESKMKGQPYGTRSQIAVAVKRDGHVVFFENFLDPEGHWRPATHNFRIHHDRIKQWNARSEL